MITKPTAKLSRGRKKWCVLFRHPKLPDAEGKPRRVRYGIGTADDEEAQKIVADLNAILADESLWNPSSKELATRRFHATAVACFYEGIESKITDPWLKREEVLALPKDGYSVVLLTGPVGAGKTTLVRQLIGTDPVHERFPATSNARTTIFDTEIICAPGDFEAVVSFLPSGQVRSYVEECVQAAVMTVAEGLGRDALARRFLVHSEEKFRLSYILGTVESGETDDDDFADEQAAEQEQGAVDDQERSNNSAEIARWLDRCETIARSVIEQLQKELGESAVHLTEKDKDAFLQLVSDKLGDHEDLNGLVDEVLEAIEKRFEFVRAGEFDRNSLGWPIRWRYRADGTSRAEFLKQIRWFSSNYAPLFGRLLTPLVEGLRVKGPFAPAGWASINDIPPLVLLDGVGLGHSKGTGVQISTSVTRRFDLADAIVLVDDATKPILDSSQAFLRAVTSSGHERKLAVVFTNFDRLKGDDLGSFKAKKDKVLNALEQGIQSVETALEVQSGAGRRLRRVLASNRVFFLGGIHETLSGRARNTQKELNALLDFMRRASQPERQPEVVPCYDLAYMVLRIRAATDEFQKHWKARLGLSYHEGVPAEHWTRIKALSRRFANQWSDEYDTMKPVAHLLALLLDKFTAFVGTPREWKPANASAEERDAAIARVSSEVAKRLEEYVARRMREEHLDDWVVAYSEHGTGSAWRRARHIRSINEHVAPVPDEMPAPVASRLLDDFRRIFREAAQAAGAEIVAG